MEETVATLAVPASSCSKTSPQTKELFEKLATAWREKSKYMSNDLQIARLKSYQRIIGLGWAAVPLILEEMRREPGRWFWALKAITGENPVPPEAAGKVRMQTQAWLQWGEANAHQDPNSAQVLRSDFRALADEWKENSHYMSNNAQMAMLDSYQRIIGMGWPVVPLILEEMRREPNHWFWALESITGENPVLPEIAGKVLLANQAWVDWGISKGLIKP